jgi:hypothetical protein
MSAFQSGFRMGGDMYQRVLDNKTRQEELAMKKAAEARAAEMHGLQADGLRRTASRENQLADLGMRMRDQVTGTDRAATTANLDADFDQAYQATGLGLQAPKMAGGSNAANEAALTVQRPVDVNSPQYQQGMAGLRAQYAITKGDMADFDRVQTAERTRIASADDSDYAMQVIRDPNGEAAVQARTFINNNSKTLGIDPPDPKTGMSTLRIIRGDRTKSVDVNPADLGKIAVGVRRLQRGDVGGLDVIAAVNKDLAAAAASEFNIDLDVAKANNETAGKSADLGIKRAEAGAKAAYYNRASRDIREFVDEKGNTVLLDASQIPVKNGQYQIPTGLRPKTARAEVTTANVIDLAKELVAAGTPDPDAPNKPLTMDKAMAVAKAQLTSGGYTSAADRLIEAYMANRGKTQEPAPAPAAGVRPPTRQITTIVPPRSGADLRPKPAMTDEDIIRLLAQ